jgi:hypothetical protein
VPPLLGSRVHAAVLLADVAIDDGDLHLWDNGALECSWLNRLGHDAPWRQTDPPDSFAGTSGGGFFSVQPTTNRGNPSPRPAHLKGIVARIDLTTTTYGADFDPIEMLPNVVGIPHKSHDEPADFTGSLLSVRYGRSRLAPTKTNHRRPK